MFEDVFVHVNYRDHADCRGCVSYFHASLVSDPQLMRTLPQLMHAVRMVPLDTFSCGVLSERVARFI
jgi:hypothetical protein